MTLKEASVVQLNVTRADIKGIVRQGDDLLVTLGNGQVVTVRGYFLTLDGRHNNLVLEDDLEGQWLVNVGQGSDSGAVPFGFTSIQSIDPLLAEPGPSDERDAVLGVWHSALAALTIAAAMYDGHSNGPTLEKLKTPQVDPVNGVKPITGFADPGATVTVTMPDGTTASAIVGADGKFSVPNPGLKDKDEITVVATSPDGADSDPVTVIVDALAPAAPKVEPVNATDPIVGHAEPHSTVTLTLPSGKTITAQVDANGNFEIANPGLKDGDKISLTATDAADNVSAKTDVVVDGLAPTLTITDDVSGIVGADGSVVFTFTFSEAVKGFDASKIKIEGGVAGDFVAVSASVYTLVVKPNLTENGEVKVHVAAGAAHDAAGNPSAAADASQSVDPVAPPAGSLHDIVLTDDVGAVVGEIKSGDQTDDSKPTYSGKANTADVALVQIYDNNKIIGNAVVGSDGRWSFEPKTPLAAGPHSFQAQAVDAAGNVGELTDAVSFQLDGPAPAAPAITGVYDDSGTITGNIQKGYPTDDKQPTIEGTATAGTIVKIWDGEVTVGSAEVDASGNWTVTTDALGDGEHKLTATATDGAGQVSPSTGEYLVLVDTIAPAKPGAPTAYGNGNVEVQPGSENPAVDTDKPKLVGHGETGEKATIYDKGVLIGTATVDSNGVWTYVPTVGLSLDAHDVTVTLTDKAGNTSEPSDVLHFVVDTVRQPVTISHALDDVAPLTEPVPDGGSTDDVTPTLVGTAPANAVVTVREGSNVIGSVQADANGNWSLALSEQAEGAHTYTAHAQQYAGGAEVTAEFGLTIDVTSPSVPTIESVGDDVGTQQVDLGQGASTDDTTPTIHGTGTAGELINIYDNGSLVGSTAVDANGQWTYTVNPALEVEGEHELTATGVDAVGNESAPSEGFVIVLDVTPPDVSEVELTVEKVAGDDYVNIAESQGNVTLTGKLQNIPDDVAHSKVVVLIGDKEYEATLSGGTWTASVPGSAMVAGGEGPASLVVKAVLSDAAGNEAQMQVTHDYVVDTTPLPEDWEKVAAALWDDVDPVQGEITTGMATNDSKPVYKGVAESNAGVAYVEILDNGKVIGRAEVQSDGSWSFEPDVALAKGDHMFQARPADIAGNPGTITPSIKFILEGAQPLPPAIEDVRDNFGPITGNIQKGVPTDDATPTLSGTAERGTVVKVFDMVDGAPVLLGEKAVNEAGQWSIEVSALADGAHHLFATATDAAGQESDATGEYLVQVDTTVPAKSSAPVAIDDVGGKTGPINSGDITDDSLPEFKGTADAGTKVQIYDNGKLIGSTTVGSNGEWSYMPTSALEDGEHSVTVVLVDSAGNASQPSDALTFGVNTEGVELVVQQVLDDQGAIKGPIANGGVTDDTTPTFVGKSTAGATVTILEGTTPVASVVADANGKWTVALPEQNEGQHAYTVSAQSVAGTIATAQFSLTVDVTAPEAPTIGGVKDDVGSVQDDVPNGGVTDDTTPSLTGTGAAGQTINIYDNGGYVGSTTANSNGEWSYTVNPAFTSEGKHELTATSQDAAGNESPASEPFVINLDVTPPDVTNVQLTVGPVTEDNIVNATESDGDVTLSGTLTGVPSDVSKTVLDVIVNGKHFVGTVSGETWSVNVPGSDLAADTDKQLEVAAKFIDAAGNSAVKQLAQTYLVDTTPPGPDSLLEYALMDDIGDKQGEIVAGDVTDDSKPRYVGKVVGEDVAEVRLLDNGVEIGVATVQTDGSWWVEPASPLGAGPHSFQLQPLDAAGNAGELTPMLDFTVAGAAPQAPAITGVYDDAGGNIQPNQPTKDAKPTLEGTATLGTEVTVYEVSAEGERVVVGSVAVDGKGQWSISTQNLSDGTHNLIATATDGAGQESVATGAYPVSIDTVAPDQPAPAQVIDQVGDKKGALVSGETTDDATPEFKGEGEAGATVTVYDGTAVIGTTTIGEDGQWSLTPATGLTQGEHSVTVTLTDKAGNVSPPSEALSFSVGTEGIELLIDEVKDDYGDITGPIANGGVTDDATPTFVGTATAGATVTIMEGTTPVTSVVADANGSWSVALPTQGEGAHAYTVNAKSVAGNMATATFALTVDLTAPEAPTIGGVTDDVGTVKDPLANGGVTDDTTPSLQGTGTSGETIHIYDNGGLVGSTTVDGDGEWAYTVNPAITSEGKHELTAVSVDAVGNESSASEPFVIFLDVTPPDVSKVQLTVDPVTADNVINATEQTEEITLSGVLVNLPSDVSKTVVSVKVGDQTLTAEIEGEKWSVAVAGSALVADPDHVFEVTASFSDAAGNSAQVLASHTYGIKLTPPNPSSIHDVVISDDIGEVTGPITAGSATDDTKPSVSGKADYPEVASVQIFDNQVLIGTATVSDTGVWNFEPEDELEVGAHSFQFRPVDAAGNIGDPTSAIGFDLAGDAPEPPYIEGMGDGEDDGDSGNTEGGGSEELPVDDLVVVENLSDGDQIALRANMTTEKEMDSITQRAQAVATLVTNDTTPTLKGTAVAGTTVKLYDVADDGTRLLVGSTVASAKGTWSITSTLLTESTHSFIATSTDSAGQISAPSVSFQLIVDITPPAKPAPAQIMDNAGDVTGAVASGGVMDDPAPVIKGTGEAGAKVKIFDNGTQVGTAVVGADGTWSYQPSTALTEGNHSITATLTDKAGNTSAASDATTFTLDTTPPQVTDTKLTVNNVTEDNIVNEAESKAEVAISGTLTGVPSDAAATKVVVTVDGVEYQATLDGGTWSAKVPGGALLTDSDLTVDVKATFTDAAGNAATLDASKTYTTDSTPPAVTDAKLTVNNVTDDNIVNEAESKADVAITGTLTGVPADSAATQVVVTVDGTEIEATIDGDTWTANVPGSALLTDSDLTVDVKATFTDAAGNAATLDASKTYTTDSTPPAVTDAKLTVNNVTDDNIINEAESKADVAITGTLTGVPADSAATKVVVMVDGTEIEATIDGDTWTA
ncbi:Ig-like domain-containing protein [Diaphorobacter sp. HDW4B]|uniref:Ig-like domain-containing protein n=1 Tax=Diaphorobacter sp. HDW4B TaxID=2714925 RepID=UPI001F0E8CAC|nr:Ig-like domain-containing protein [Diaphorobacter sp. HDW4B]